MPSASGHTRAVGGPSGQPTSSLTFTEVVHHLADQQGLSVLPHDRRGTHEGKRLFLLGGATFYIYNDVVFMETRAKSSTPGEKLPPVFAPVSVEQLLSAAAASGAARRGK